MSNCARLRALVDPSAEAMADGERLTALVVEGQNTLKLVDALKPFAKKMIGWAFEHGQVDGYEILDLAKELGLVVEEPYDPEKHEHLSLDDAVEDGDPIYVESTLLK